MSVAATASTVNTAHFITQCLLRSTGYAEKLLADIPADKFAFTPLPNMNHPAFIIGHLSLYPKRVFTLIGRTDLIAHLPEHPGWQELFQAGSPCLPDAGKYPPKEALTSAFFEGYRQLAAVLPGVDDETLARDNPMEGRMREIFPIVGTAVNFLCNNHLMMHLGQISMWRRTIGLGSAM
jgi:hypothetical protein